MDLLIWAGKVSLYWLFFYGCFYFFLRKLTHFHWNRVYLLTSLVLSLVLPFLKIPESATEPLVVYAVQLDPMAIIPRPESNSPISWMGLLGIAYFTVVLFMLYRMTQKLLTLRLLWRDTISIETENGDATIYLLPDNKISSFSFFRKIGISHSDYAGHFDKILSHEMVHVKQRHSFDIVLTEVLTAFFWFHPVLPLFKKSLQEIHEFLADENTENRDHYAEFLVAYALGKPTLSLVNNFYSSSLLKQRIQMLYKNKSSNWKFSLYGISGILAIALIVIVAACSDSNKMAETEPQPNAERLEATSADDKIFTAVENNPQFPGGTAEMYKFLRNNIKYPDAASRANVGGRVFLQFVVKSDGSISDVMVVKGIGFGCDAEAIRVVKAMPKWTPGSQSGKPVNVRYTLPINFELEGEESIPVDGDPSILLKTDSKPIYIVDGKIMEVSSREHLKTKPEEIESISVLKGQSAIDKYGEKAKDGAIEITTKKKK